MASVQRRLAEAEVPEARLEAELLLAHVLHTDRTRLYALTDAVLSRTQEQELECLLARRLRREPLAYILGARWFYGLEFAVKPGVLIPRPETELLVERAIALAGDRPVTIADVGTGCGNVAVALAVHLPRARLLAADISPIALQVAAENAARHGVAERVTFLHGDLLAPLSRNDLGILPPPQTKVCGMIPRSIVGVGNMPWPSGYGRGGEPLPPRTEVGGAGQGSAIAVTSVDMIVANLPYVRRDTLPSLQPELRYEPVEALDGGPDGLDLLRRLLAQAPAYLASGGWLLAELDPWQAAEASALARASFPGARVEAERDLTGHERLLVVST